MLREVSLQPHHFFQALPRAVRLVCLQHHAPLIFELEPRHGTDARLIEERAAHTDAQLLATEALELAPP